MKLATVRNGTRDGRLVIVTRDLSRAADASTIAPTLQGALDNWEELGPRLVEFAEKLERGDVPSVLFDASQARSPLPRAYQWADGSAYVNHVELVRKARGAEMPSSFRTDPLMYQGGSDMFLDPHEPIRVAHEDYGIDIEAEVAVIVGDIPIGATAASTVEMIRLVTIANDISFRNLVPAELGKGFGFFHSKPSTAFGPIAVTPDELAPAWSGGRLHLPMLVEVNGFPFGMANAGIDMTFDFPTLISHAAKTRALSAGTIIGSGTISNRSSDGSSSRTIAEGGVGYSCIAELRMIETIRLGAPRTSFLKFGDNIRIEMKDLNERSIFGAIEQTVKRIDLPSSAIPSSFF